VLRVLKQIISSEKGQALPIVLALLVIGGLTIVPSLNHTFTGLNSSRMLEDSVKGVYAADAGVEDVLWSLANEVPAPTQLSQNINQLEVDILTEEKGIYTIYLGELVEPGEHFDYLDIVGDLAWDEEAQAYKYTITVTWLPTSGEPVIHLDQVGARIPIGYSYQTGSAADFEDNLSTDEPDEILDVLGAYLLNWEFEPPKPDVSQADPVETQTFYITGDGELENYYTWIVANRDDIGAVGEITGGSYRITATATRPENNETAARIVAEAMTADETVYVLSWQVLN